MATSNDDLTINELLVAFTEFAVGHYRHPSGEPTGELTNFKYRSVVPRRRSSPRWNCPDPSDDAADIQRRPSIPLLVEGLIDAAT